MSDAFARTPTDLSEQAEIARSFNRFYTRQIGLLGEGLLKSEFSLTEVRVLYELAHRDGLTATDLRRDLGLDPGYLSRILRKFEARGFLVRTPAQHDGRQVLLALTRPGSDAFDPLNKASQEQMREILSEISCPDREKLIAAMTTIRRLMGGADEPKVPYLLRAHQPGDIGWVTHRQAVLYNREYGWDETFEALVAEIAATFIRSFDPKYERCWIAERDEEIVGSVFVVRASEEAAKLRLLYVEPSARDLGIGRRLVGECIRFARSKGYKTLTLWTNDVLKAARHIYETEGFVLTAEEPHHSFGKDLVGQNWNLVL